MRLVFMGTPDIAAASLAALIKKGHEIACVYTREDKPVGRKQTMTPPAVKALAITHNIPVFQPKSLRNGDVIAQLAQIAPELIVVVAYGRILPKEILDLPRYGCINLHVSLLPKYRGAAPIQWAVINGDSKTGVTIQHMSEGVDEGDIIETVPVDIDPEETSGELFAKVSELGANTLCAVIDKIKAGNTCRTPQDADNASFAPMLTKEMANIDFSLSCEKLHNIIRGLNPWPIARFVHENKQIKVLRASCAKGAGAQCKEVLALKPLTIACGSGALILEELIPEGSKRMSGTDWAVGKRLSIGQIL